MSTREQQPLLSEGGQNRDSGGDGESAPSLNDKLDTKTRHAFVRKVFLIVFAQLVCTAGIIAGLGNTIGKQNHDVLQGISIGGLVLYLVIVCTVMCNPQLMRRFPQNYIFLGLITVGFSCMLTAAVMAVEPWVVGAAVGTTALITLGLVIFACQVKYDFTGWGPYLFWATIALMVVPLAYYLLSCCIPALRVYAVANTFRLIMAYVGLIVFSLWLIVDTQMIVGGKNRRIQFSIDDYCFAALMLYLDIMQIFMYLLQIFGNRG